MIQMKKKNNIMRGFAWKFSERLISQGVSFVVSLILARLLLPEDYGIISLVTVFISLSNVFISSGFSTALIQKKDADLVDFSTMFICSFSCSLIIYLIIFIAAPFFADFYNLPIITDVLRVYALQIPLGSYNTIQNAYISRNMIFNKLFRSTMISAIVSGTVGIIMAFLGFGVWALVTQSLTSVISNTIILGFTIPWHPKLEFSLKSAKNLMRFGSQVLFADLSGTFFGELRSLIIGRVYTSADLAYYSKGQHLPKLITGNLSTALIAVLFPAMSNESDHLERVKSLAKQSLKLLSYVLFPALFGLSMILPPLIELLYTSKWNMCIPYGQILCIGQAIGILGIVPLQTLKAIGRSDVVLNLEIIKKPVYVLLLLIGVKINVFAIAVTMVIYEFYGVAVNMYQMKKYINYSIKEQLIDILPASILATFMALIVYLLPIFNSLILTIIVKLAIGLAIYLIGSLLLKFDEYDYIKNILLKIIKKQGVKNEYYKKI